MFSFTQLWRHSVSFLSRLFSLLLPVGVAVHAVNDLQRFLKLYAERKLNLKALLDKFVFSLCLLSAVLKNGTACETGSWPWKISNQMVRDSVLCHIAICLMWHVLEVKKLLNENQMEWSDSFFLEHYGEMIYGDEHITGPTQVGIYEPLFTTEACRVKWPKIKQSKMAYINYYLLFPPNIQSNQKKR